MNLAVKFYNTMPTDDENVMAGIDGKIPAVVVFDTTVVPDDSYQIMTEEAYREYLLSISAEMQAWKQIQTSTIG